MNVLENFLAGRQARREQDAADQTNAMNGFLQQNGQAIFNGDQNALGQLAGFGVEGLQTAMGAQETRQAMESRDLGMQQTRQNMDFSAEEMQMKRDQVRQQASEALIAQQGKIDAATLEAERAKLEKGLAMGSQAQTPEQWDQAMTMVGQEDYVGQFENRHMIMAGAMGLKDAIDTFAPPKPNSAEAKLKADLTAGLINENEYQLGLQRLAPKGQTITSDGKGGLTIISGPGVGGGNTAAAAFGGSAMDVDAVLGEIDAIRTDKALPRVIGPVEGGGGNNIDDMNMMQRMYYKGDGLSLIEKIGQLQNKTWLGARDMLKGGGAITDFESKKAEGAMARLSRAKSEAEFDAALMDLRDAIVEGKRKLESAGGQAPVEVPSAGAPQQPALSPDAMKYLGLE